VKVSFEQPVKKRRQAKTGSGRDLMLFLVTGHPFCPGTDFFAQGQSHTASACDVRDHIYRVLDQKRAQQKTGDGYDHEVCTRTRKMRLRRFAAHPQFTVQRSDMHHPVDSIITEIESDERSNGQRC